MMSLAQNESSSKILPGTEESLAVGEDGQLADEEDFDIEVPTATPVRFPAS